MSSIHFMNVGDGDCIFIDHFGGRQTLIDICGGNRGRDALTELLHEFKRADKRLEGDYGMCESPVHPLDYLSDLGVESIWRFISTHPDMDHLDGLDALCDAYHVQHIWTSGVEKEKPDFSKYERWNEADWDRYEDLRKGNESGTKPIKARAGARFQYANKPENEHDGLYIRSPNKALVQEAEEKKEFNDASYVIDYRCSGCKALFPGDAHDRTWEYVLDNWKKSVSGAQLLAAPHHGRKSGRSYDFLDVVNPELTLFGCAPSKDLAYDAWNYRDLEYITTNQAGCVVVECAGDQMDVYVENETFAADAGGDTSVTNGQGFYFYTTLGGGKFP